MELWIENGTGTMPFFGKNILGKLKKNKTNLVKRIIKSHNTELVTAIISRVNYAAMVANDLYNANLLSERYFLEMIPYVNKTDPEMDVVFASSIVTQVRLLLYDDPEAFLDVMTVLKKHSPMDDVAIKMEREYCKLCAWCMELQQQLNLYCHLIDMVESFFSPLELHFII